MLCDWLPPDFGAVGQYAAAFAAETAADGHDVTLAGFSSTAASVTVRRIAAGSLTVQRIHRPAYDKSDWFVRVFWTIKSNFALLWAARRALKSADEVRFTGSPPYVVHVVMPVATLLRLRTRYRITDFHPECLVASLGRMPLWLKPLAALTNFWRRRVDTIEVLGEDQRRRLMDAGVAANRIMLRRDPSPVEFSDDARPAEPPHALRDRKLILYSGNWGIAHDYETFLRGFEVFCAAHPDAAGFWLNATGRRADVVEQWLKERGLPYARTRTVPLHELPAVLMCADVHLITLDDRFVGYVLPSKVYACVESGRPVLFVGSETSDVHLVCSERLPARRYRQVAAGDHDAVASALEELLLNGAAATKHAIRYSPHVEHSQIIQTL